MTDYTDRLIDERRYEYGRIAYEGYIAKSGGVSLVTGDKLPPFSELKQDIRDAWAAAAEALTNYLADKP